MARFDPVSQRFRSLALDEHTRAAGAAAHLARTHSTGTDMGLQGGTIDIEPTSDVAVSQNTPFATAIADQEASVRGYDVPTLHLRPSSADFADSSLKDVWSHEIGHAVQFAALGGGGIGQSYYQQAYNAQGILADVTFPALPDECRCDFVQEGYSAGHCSNSVETINAAQGEGFGNAFGLRLYNNPGDTDCWQANSKWMLAPACPDFSANPMVQGKVQCHPIAGLTQAELDAFGTQHHLQGVPSAATVANGEPWVLIEAPVMVDCAAATQWTLSRCIDPNVATPDLDPSRIGNENDWTQFFWGLTAQGVSSQGEVWTMTDALRPYQVACAGTPPGGTCVTEMTWGVLTTTVGSLVNQGIQSTGQQVRFLFMGDSRGVSQ